MRVNKRIRIASSIVALLMVISFAPMSSETAYADSIITSGDYAYTVLDDGTAQMIGYCGTNSSVEYPASIDGYAVTRVGWEDSNYDLCPDFVTNIVLPDTVVSIGNYAFGNAESLQSITLGTGLKTIEEEAFNGCTSLQSVEIPSGVTTIGNSAFCDCSSMTSASIPSSVTALGDYVFIRCSALKNLAFNAKIDHIGLSVFGNCSSLTSMKIPNGVTYISAGAFADCTSLASVTIPSSVTDFGWDSFQNTNLTSVTIPGKSVYIDRWAFGDCKNLKKYTIKDPMYIHDKAIGFYENSAGELAAYSGVTIYSKPGSCAQGYAKKFGFKFVDPNAKKANTMKVTAAAKSIKASKLKKANQTVKPITISKAKGTVKVTKKKNGTTASIYKKITVNKKTGAITFKKGKYAKKTYKVKLTIYASGNSSYEKKTITKTVKIKIK